MAQKVLLSEPFFICSAVFSLLISYLALPQASPAMRLLAERSIKIANGNELCHGVSRVYL
jgi:hypothetical protein